jgi:hypothetical protein
MTQMILVGGTGRSGTSIVKEILATHSEAASLPFEYRFIIDPDGLVDFYTSFTNSWSPYLADRRLKRLEHLLGNLGREPWYHRLLGRLIRSGDPDGKFLSPRIYHRWALNRHLPNFDRHVQSLMSQLVEFSFPACWVGTESYQLFPRVYHASPMDKRELAQVLGKFIRNVIDDFLQCTGKRFFVEDNTWNVLFAPELYDLIPEAKLIHVYRDPRDVVASFSHQRWSPTDKRQGALWYKAIMTHWFSVRATLPADSYYELKLEDLVSSPAEELRSLCEFAQISLEETMLEMDLSRSHGGRWKKEYSPEEKRHVQSILQDVIKKLGYNLEA